MQTGTEIRILYPCNGYTQTCKKIPMKKGYVGAFIDFAIHPEEGDGVLIAINAPCEEDSLVVIPAAAASVSDC